MTKEETGDVSLEDTKKKPTTTECFSPVESPIDDQQKTKRGRKPSQAKLAMMESKKIFAEKRRFFDADSSKRHTKRKKVLDESKLKKNDVQNNLKKKKKKITKSNDDIDDTKSFRGKKHSRTRLTVEEDEGLMKRRTRRNKPECSSEEEDTSEEELWAEDPKRLDDPWDAFFADSDGEHEFLQNSDEGMNSSDGDFEDTEDASETDMATLEEEISEMKEQMYQEKIKELKEQLQQLEDRILPEYLKRLKELKEHKEEWIRMAYAFKTYQEKELEKEFDREKRLTKQDFESKRSELKDLLVKELGERKKLIECEKSNVELTSNVGLLLPMETKPAVTRKLRRRPNDPPPTTEKKRKTTSAQLCFLLEEESILADLKKINKNFKTEDKCTVGEVETANKTEKCDPTQFPDGTDAKIKDDKLYFNKEWYESGDPIYLNSRDGERFTAQIHSITATREIWIKKFSEGTRLKIYVGHLQRGKYSIERRPAKK